MHLVRTESPTHTEVRVFEVFVFLDVFGIKKSAFIPHLSEGYACFCLFFLRKVVIPQGWMEQLADENWELVHKVHRAVDTSRTIVPT